jgi:hypothetical protein
LLRENESILKWTSHKVHDALLLAGALHANTKLQTLDVDEDSERKALSRTARAAIGEALLANPFGSRLGYCNIFQLTQKVSASKFDCTDPKLFPPGDEHQANFLFLVGLLSANRKLRELTLDNLQGPSRQLELLAAALRKNTALEVLHLLGKRIGEDVKITLPVQRLTGEGEKGGPVVDLSVDTHSGGQTYPVGLLNSASLHVIGALMAENTKIERLRLSGTRLGEVIQRETGEVLQPLGLGPLCALTALHLSGTQMSDLAGKRLFVSLRTGRHVRRT